MLFKIIACMCGRHETPLHVSVSDCTTGSSYMFTQGGCMEPKIYIITGARYTGHLASSLVLVGFGWCSGNIITFKCTEKKKKVKFFFFSRVKVWRSIYLTPKSWKMHQFYLVHEISMSCGNKLLWVNESWICELITNSVQQWLSTK